MDKGAKKVIVGVTHAVFSGLAMERLAESPISSVVVTNTIPGGPRFDPIREKVVELCVGSLIGDAIHAIHHHRAVSALFQRGVGTKR